MVVIVRQQHAALSSWWTRSPSKEEEEEDLEQDCPTAYPGSLGIRACFCELTGRTRAQQDPKQSMYANFQLQTATFEKSDELFYGHFHLLGPKLQDLHVIGMLPPAHPSLCPCSASSKGRTNIPSDTQGKIKIQKGERKRCISNGKVPGEITFPGSSQEHWLETRTPSIITSSAVMTINQR